MKPIIYSELKVGDEVIHEEGALGKVIAVTPEASPDYRFTVFWGGRAQDRGGQGQIASYAADGRFTATTNRVVFLAPKPKVKHRAWLNLYANGEAFSHASEDDANGFRSAGRCECRLIEWEVEP